MTEPLGSLFPVLWLFGLDKLCRDRQISEQSQWILLKDANWDPSFFTSWVGTQYVACRQCQFITNWKAFMVKTPATCCGPFELRRQAFLRLWIHHHMPSLPKNAHCNFIKWIRYCFRSLLGHLDWRRWWWRTGVWLWWRARGLFFIPLIKMISIKSWWFIESEKGPFGVTCILF